MTSNPLVGRHVRFDGQHQGTEGIVLDAKFDGRHTTLVLEVTKAPILPTEIDGAHLIQVFFIDHAASGIYAMPPAVDVDTLKAAATEMLAALDGMRETRFIHVEDPRRQAAHKRISAARAALEGVLGLPVTRRGPPVCQHCGEIMPAPNVSRACTVHRAPDGPGLCHT